MPRADCGDRGLQIVGVAALLLSCTARPVDIPDTAVAPPPPPLPDLSSAPDMPPPPRPQHNAQGWISSFGPKAYLTDARLDHDGNVYLYGTYKGDTVINHDKLTAPAPYDVQLLVAKAGPDGAALWGIAASNAPMGSVDPAGMAVDTEGNIYITGKFSGIVSFGSHTRTSTENGDMFLARVSAQGTVDWAVSAGGDGIYNDVGSVVAVSPTGTVLVAGRVTGKAAFGSVTIQSTSPIAFIAAYESVTGKLLWVDETAPLGGNMHDNRIAAIAARAGGFYVAGRFCNQVSIGGQVVKALKGLSGVYLASVTETGTVEWLTEVLSTTDLGEVNVGGIATDGDGNIYVTGRSETAYVVAGQAPMKPVFLIKTSSTGVVQWSAHPNGPSYTGVGLQALKNGGADWALTNKEYARVDAFGDVVPLTEVMEHGVLGLVHLGCAADGCRYIGNCGEDTAAPGTFTALGMQVTRNGTICILNRYADGPGH